MLVTPSATPSASPSANTGIRRPATLASARPLSTPAPQRKPLRVLGVDPGFDRTGYGVIDQSGSSPVWIHHSCLQTSVKSTFEYRLQQQRDELAKVIEAYKPDVAIVEQLFFSNNAKSVMKVGMARGVIFLALADAKLPIVEITPNQVKQGIAGWGAADKKAVGEMVVRMLRLKSLPEPDDAADALAIAIVGGLYARTGLLRGGR